jgi:hypothetical protein
MRDHAFLHRLVVIGYDRQHGISTGALGLSRQLDRAIGRIGSGARNDAGAALRGLGGAANEAEPFCRRQRRRLAGGFADDDRRSADLDLAFAQRGESFQIKLVTFAERGRKVGNLAGEPACRIRQRGH